MSRINVHIVDETVNDVEQLITGGSPAVYVIGFSTEDNYYNPTYCDTISDFTAAFGTTAVKYGANVKYSDYYTANAYDSTSTSTAADTQYVIKQNDYDIGYIYALNLLKAGIPVVYEAVDGTLDSAGESVTAPENIIKYMADTLSDHVSPFNEEEGSLININEYNIQYITSGGIPVIECKAGIDGNVNYIASLMSAVAEARGDCVALLDHTNYAARPFTGDKGFIKNGVNQVLSASSFGTKTHTAVFTPWGTYTGIDQCLPASFGYLSKYANSISINAPWLAIAGVNRGLITGFVPNTSAILTNNIADLFVEADVPINAISNVSGYGQTIMGNNTALTPTSTILASQKLNLMVLVALLIKKARTAAMKFLFEQNTDNLFIKYKAEITPLLEQMQTSGGIKSFKILKDLTQSSKCKLYVIIRIYTIYAVEAIDISIKLRDDEEA